MTRQYRPRHPRSSPLWQCLHDSLESFTSGYYPDRSKYLGPLDPSREIALHDSLRCGDLASGFLRVQCPDCDYHYLLPFPDPPLLRYLQQQSPRPTQTDRNKPLHNCYAIYGKPPSKFIPQTFSTRPTPSPLARAHLRHLGLRPPQVPLLQQ